MTHYSQFREQQIFEDLNGKDEDSSIWDKIPRGNAQALRFNEGKPELSRIDLRCLEGIAHVLKASDSKYPRGNWKLGLQVSQLLDSLLRHIRDLQEGNIVDDESQQSVISHIQANAMFLGNVNNIDDVTKDGTLYKNNLHSR